MKKTKTIAEEVMPNNFIKQFFQNKNQQSEIIANFILQTIFDKFAVKLALMQIQD